jgi:hypothetical protein
VDDESSVEMPQRRPPPAGARCDVCHERGERVRRTTDGLLAICSVCARGVDVTAVDSTEAIAALVPRAPAGERRLLTRRLLARRSMHSARRERRERPPRVTAPPPESANQATEPRPETTSPTPSTPL